MIMKLANLLYFGVLFRIKEAYDIFMRHIIRHKPTIQSPDQASQLTNETKFKKKIFFRFQISDKNSKNIATILIIILSLI